MIFTFFFTTRPLSSSSHSLYHTKKRNTSSRKEENEEAAAGAGKYGQVLGLVSVMEPPPQTVDDVTQTLNEDALNSQINFGGGFITL